MTLKKTERLTAPDYILAGMSGLMISFSFPDHDVWPLAWVGLIPLFMALKGKQSHHGAWLGVVAGLFYFGPTLPWLSNTMIDYGHIPELIAHTITALTITMASFYIGLFGYLYTRTARRYSEEYAMLWAPFMWVAVEMLRMHVPVISFPWARIADSQYSVLPIIQIADIFGEEGVCFLIVAVNAALAMVVTWYLARADRSVKKPIPIMSTAGVLVLVALAVVYGTWSLNKRLQTKETTVKAALIQGNIDQSRKWDKTYKDEQLAIYVNRTKEAVGNGAQIVVWPETAAPFYFSADKVYDSIVENLSRQSGVPIVFGAPGFKRDGDNFISYNRAWIITPNGQKDKYDKVHLVPLGEYVPLKKLLFFVEKVVTAVGNMEPGNGFNVLDTGQYKAGVQICYEIIFPDYSREMTKNGAGAILNITNDSWFGDSPASRQSMAMAVFRAVENRVPVLRSAQSGVSAIISASGMISGETNLFEEATVLGEFSPKQDDFSYYTSGGWLFGRICALVVVLQMMVVFRNNG